MELTSASYGVEEGGGERKRERTNDFLRFTILSYPHDSSSGKRRVATSLRNALHGDIVCFDIVLHHCKCKLQSGAARSGTLRSVNLS